MPKEILIGLISLAAVFGIPIAWSILRPKKRKQALSELAQQLGWTLNTDRLKLAATPCFTGKDKPRVDNVMEGSVSGLRARMFDFRYDEGGDDATVTRVLTTAAFSSPEHQLPTFVLKKKGLFGSSRDRVEVAGQPEFVKHFVVTGKDKLSISSLFNPQLVDFLLSTNHNKEKLCLEGAGPWLVFYRQKTLGGAKLSPKQWAAFLQETSQIAAGFFQIAAKAAPAAVGSAS